MDESTLTRPKGKTTAGYKTAVAHMLTEMDLLDGRIDKNRAEIERLKIETQVIKARTSANLTRLQEQIRSLSRVV